MNPYLFSLIRSTAVLPTMPVVSNVNMSRCMGVPNIVKYNLCDRDIICTVQAALAKAKASGFTSEYNDECVNWVCSDKDKQCVCSIQAFKHMTNSAHVVAFCIKRGSRDAFETLINDIHMDLDGVAINNVFCTAFVKAVCVVAVVTGVVFQVTGVLLHSKSIISLFVITSLVITNYHFNFEDELKERHGARALDLVAIAAAIDAEHEAALAKRVRINRCLEMARSLCREVQRESAKELLYIIEAYEVKNVFDVSVMAASLVYIVQCRNVVSLDARLHFTSLSALARDPQNLQLPDEASHEAINALVELAKHSRVAAAFVSKCNSFMNYIRTIAHNKLHDRFFPMQRKCVELVTYCTNAKN